MITLRGRRGAYSGTVLGLGALLVLLTITGLSAFALLQNERAAFASLEATSAAQLADEHALELVIDEETGMRGYVATHDASFLEPYVEARRRESQVFNELRRAVAHFDDPSMTRRAEDLQSLSERWRREVAEPLVALRFRENGMALRVKGKAYVERIRHLAQELDEELDRRFGDAEALAETGFARVAVATFIALVVAAALMVGVAVRQYRLREERTRDRRMIGALHGAFVNRWQGLPHARIGTAYLSATRDAAVGGDLFDVRRRGDGGVVLVGDVAGKGIDAALDTVLVRYAIATLAELYDEPAEILDRLNRQYAESVGMRDTFVVLFLGVVDGGGKRLRYASAGHPSAWLVRSGRARTLEVTGPVLGVMQDVRYETRSIDLMPRDVVVLATDGLTDAWDRTYGGGGVEEATRWIESSPLEDPQPLVDALIRRVRETSGADVGDDLAMVAVRIEI